MSAPLDPATIYGPCSICGAVQQGEWPHPFGAPCPLNVALDEAYIAMLDAQRMSYIRSAGGVEAMGEAMRRISGDDE